MSDAPADTLNDLHDLVSELYDPVTQSYMRDHASKQQFSNFIQRRADLSNKADRLLQAEFTKIVAALQQHDAAFKKATADLNRSLNNLRQVATILNDIAEVIAIAAKIVALAA